MMNPRLKKNLRRVVWKSLRIIITLARTDPPCLRPGLDASNKDAT